MDNEKLKMKVRELLIKEYSLTNKPTFISFENLSESDILDLISNIENTIKNYLLDKLNYFHRQIYNMDDHDIKFDLNLSLNDFEELFYRRMIEYSITKNNNLNYLPFNYKTDINELENLNIKLMNNK